MPSQISSSSKADTFLAFSSQLPTEGGGFDLTEKKIIDRLHAHGVGVMYWVINDKETMLRLIKNGADGIITDEVDLLRTAMDEAGKELPAGI